MVRQLVILLAFFIGASRAPACSLSFEPLDRPSSRELVAFGALAKIEDADAASPDATAILTLRDVRFVSKTETRFTVQIAVHQLMADCTYGRFSAQELLSLFPVQSEVAVVAEIQDVAGQKRFVVYQGGNSSIDLADDLSEKFKVRRDLAELEDAAEIQMRAAILRRLIPDTTGDIDLVGAIQRYLPAGKDRDSVLQQCRQHWSQWPGPNRCE